VKGTDLIAEIGYNRDVYGQNQPLVLLRYSLFGSIPLFVKSFIIFLDYMEDIPLASRMIIHKD
jgi:hypothetical protein